MSRKAARRAERGPSLTRRLLAAATTVFLALGMSVGGAGAAFANHGGQNPQPLVPVAGVEVVNDNGLVCDAAGYEKPDGPNGTNRSAGEYTDVWGEITWDGSSITWTLNQGFDVDLCVKGSVFLSKVDTSAVTGDTYNFTAQTGHGISHVGFIVRSTPTTVTPVVANVDTCELRTVTITEVVGVTYTLKINTVVTPIVFASGSAVIPVPAGATVEVSAAPSSASFVLAGSWSTFSQTFKTAAECDVDDAETVTPVVANVDTCELRTVTITEVVGVTYTLKINTVVTPIVFASGSAVIPVPAGATVEVSAAPSSASFVLAGSWSTFTKTFKTAQECLPTLGTASVTFDWTAPTCELPGTVSVNPQLTSNATLVAPAVDTPAGTFIFQAAKDTQFSDSEPPAFTNPTGAPTITSVTMNEAKTVLTVVIAIPPKLSGPICDELTTEGTASVTFNWTAATCDLPGAVTVNPELTANATLVAPGLDTPAGTFTFQADEDAQFSDAEPPKFTNPTGAPTITSVTMNEAKTTLTVVIALPVKLTGALCDDLTTLAFTGTSPMVNGLGVLAVLITLAGIGMVVRRRVEV